MVVIMRTLVTILLLLCLFVSPVLADVSYNDRIVASTGTVYLSTHAVLTSEDAVLHYAITGTSSKQLPSMTIMPQIWKCESPENILVFTGEPVTCMDATGCTAEGTFTPTWDFANVTATYVTGGTMMYTVPDEFLLTEARGSTGQYELSYQSGDATLVPEVVVTGTLNLLGPGEVADPLNANNTIPFGGIIEHGIQGDIPMTVVYDAKGQPQYLADDRKTSDAFTPGGLKKATWVHEVPSGTFINETSESSLEYNLNGERI